MSSILVYNVSLAPSKKATAVQRKAVAASIAELLDDKSARNRRGIATVRPDLMVEIETGEIARRESVPRKILKNRFAAWQHVEKAYVLTSADLADKEPTRSMAESVRIWIARTYPAMAEGIAVVFSE